MRLPYALNLLLPFALLGAAESEAIQVWSIDLTRQKDVPATPVRESSTQPAATTETTVITLDPSTRYQTMAGIGAAFSEIGTLAIQSLPEAKRKALVESLFNVQTGAGFAMCRLPVGSSDFATSAYSYAETPDDFALASFSIARDRASILPVVKAALAVNPAMNLFASPWSPPGWMKTSGTMDKGGKDSHLRGEERIYQTYADYLVRYLQAYQAEGVTIARLSPQNEADCNPTYPGNVMDPTQMVPFVVKHLAPRLKASGLTTELWAGTFREKPTVAWATTCLEDPAFRAAIQGLAIQYFNGHTVADLVKAHPGVRLMHSEADCRNGKNTAEQAQERLPEMIGIFNAGCDTYAYWNMALDENQKSGWNWAQNSLVTIDRTSGGICYQPDFQPVCLASRAIRPGDVRIASTLTGTPALPLTAFQKPDGSLTVLTQNRTTAVCHVRIRVGTRDLRADLPPQTDCVLRVPASPQP